MSVATIPPKNRPEWHDLVTGKIDYTFQNYVLQIKTYQMRKDIQSGRMTASDAVDQLYAICDKYAKAVQSDCTNIFKTW